MDHRLWPRSSRIITDNRLKLLYSFSSIGWPGAQPGQSLSERSAQFADVNGDGLIDVLSYYMNEDWYNYYTMSRESVFESAILLNKGNFTFNHAYQCYDGDVTGYAGPHFTNPIHYYGDCAAG